MTDAAIASNGKSGESRTLSDLTKDLIPIARRSRNLTDAVAFTLRDYVGKNAD
jgi:hypothetical protein